MDDLYNVCQGLYLGKVSVFKRDNTGHLMAVARIDYTVTPRVISTPNTDSLTPPVADTPEEEEHHDLENSKKNYCGRREAKSDMASPKHHLGNLKPVTADLADKRCVSLEALAVVDTLWATHACEKRISDHFLAQQIPIKWRLKLNCICSANQMKDTTQGPSTYEKWS